MVSVGFPVGSECRDDSRDQYQGKMEGLTVLQAASISEMLLHCVTSRLIDVSKVEYWLIWLSQEETTISGWMVTC